MNFEIILLVMISLTLLGLYDPQKRSLTFARSEGNKAKTQKYIYKRRLKDDYKYAHS